MGKLFLIRPAIVLLLLTIMCVFAVKAQIIHASNVLSYRKVSIPFDGMLLRYRIIKDGLSAEKVSRFIGTEDPERMRIEVEVRSNGELLSKEYYIITVEDRIVRESSLPQAVGSICWELWPVPLSVGAKFTIKDPETGAEEARVAVVGEETITVLGKPCTCWVVEGREWFFGGSWKTWVEKNTGVTVREIYRLGNEEEDTELIETNIPDFPPAEIVESETPSCIIVTAAYGSEVEADVTFLREFRDNVVAKTFVGENIVSIFNSWYYSWSPPVACFISDKPWLRAIVRISLYPLITSFHIAKNVYKKLSFSPEIAVIVSLLTVGSLAGLTYLMPFTFLTLYIYKQKFRKTPRVNMVKFLLILFLANIAVIIIGYLTGSSLLIAAASTSLILQATVFIPLILSLIMLKIHTP